MIITMVVMVAMLMEMIVVVNGGNSNARTP